MEKPIYMDNTPEKNEDCRSEKTRVWVKEGKSIEDNRGAILLVAAHDQALKTN